MTERKPSRITDGRLGRELIKGALRIFDGVPGFDRRDLLTPVGASFTAGGVNYAILLDRDEWSDGVRGSALIVSSSEGQLMIESGKKGDKPHEYLELRAFRGKTYKGKRALRKLPDFFAPITQAA